ncbi:hypothetical protein OG897_33065 [Streptomyces sp. NBC_00237]|uniref:DUF6417 family protein n=1 Tax=Streptomyces sp. NBC_00237 TaxID=2975687 RepID=UPI002252A0C6|nr:DUF6417 family protein [Streptomyces sp. NBC_00237]MCX5206223.1 hypothetical protein [Streptomyces sp. NBC_00237]
MPQPLPAGPAATRLALFSLDEAHDLLRLLRLIAAEDDELAAEAGWFATLLTDRVPPEN